jgi:PAS domain S-box-containing protein
LTTISQYENLSSRCVGPIIGGRTGACIKVPERRLLREILDAQLEMVCRFRSDGSIIYVNRAYAETLGTTAEALTGCNLWNFIAPQDRDVVEAQLETLTPERPTVQIENRLEAASGTRWTLWRNMALDFDADGRWLVAQSSGYDVTERKQLEEQRQLLLDELNHRVRNTLMVVQGMAYQSFKGDNVPRAQLANFNARLHALAAAHNALSRSNWNGASLVEMAREGMAIAGARESVTLDGPDLSLRPGAAEALVLILHELTTNAVKYGALSADGGTVRLFWTQRSDGWVDLAWVERGGPVVAPPQRTGFGSRLITSSVTGQLGGQVAFDYAPEGLSCRMQFPLQRGNSGQVSA